MSIVKQAVLEAGVLEIGRFQFSGDTEDQTKANNKLNFDNLYDHPESLHIVVHHLGRVVHAAKPDALLGIKSGGERLACKINEDPEFLTLPMIHLDKDEERSVNGKKAFTFSSPEDKELLEQVDSLVVVEDVFRKFTNTLGVLAVEGVLEKTRLVAGVWDRGFHPSRAPLPVPHEALVTEYIPRWLRRAEELYLHGVEIEE